MGLHTEMDTKWLLTRLAERNKSIAGLARAVGRDRAAMSRIVNGEQPFQLWMAPIIADELGVTQAEVLSRTGEVKLPPLTSAPLIPWHSAGAFAMTAAPIDVNASYERVLVPGDSNTLIALRTDDEAMAGLLPVGSVVVIDYGQKDLRSGEVGAFALGNQSVLRKWRTNRRKKFLVAIGEDGEREQEVDGAVEVIGRLTSVPVFARTA